MNSGINNLWPIAVHEAGHCLGCRLAGLQIRIATVVPTDSYNGCVQTNAFDLAVMRFDSHVLYTMLGYAATLEFGFRNRFQGSSDYREAIRLLRLKVQQQIADRVGLTRSINTGKSFYQTIKEWSRVLHVEKKDWQPQYSRLWRRARRLAKKHRAWIESTATLLMRRGTLTDEEIPQLSGQPDKRHFQLPDTRPRCSALASKQDDLKGEETNEINQKTRRAGNR